MRTMRQLPVAAPRALPRPGSPIRPNMRPSHELCRQRNVPDAAGRRHAGRAAGGVPALSPDAICGQAVNRIARARSASFAIRILSAWMAKMARAMRMPRRSRAWRVAFGAMTGPRPISFAPAANRCLQLDAATDRRRCTMPGLRLPLRPMVRLPRPMGSTGSASAPRRTAISFSAAATSSNWSGRRTAFDPDDHIELGFCTFSHPADGLR